MAAKVALVTGANKGIGYAIVKQLCQRGVQFVYLGSRDLKKGQEAVQKLKNEGLTAYVAEIDVTIRDTIMTLAETLKGKHGGLDILFNNAGVAPADFLNTTYEDSKHVIEVNYKGAINVQDYLFPILKENARVINVSSNCGVLSNIRNELWTKRLANKDISLGDVNAFVDWFLDSVKNDTLNLEDFIEPSVVAYRVSKVGLSTLTRVQQVMYRNISINTLHPGYVKTDMTAGAGLLTIDEAAVAPTYLALDAPQSLKGAFVWFDKTERNWIDPDSDLYCRFEFFEKALLSQMQ